ncbi:MAG TPA: ABC transporter substrate-binding protein [Sphingomicrobium sp.]|jgi:peptide/nickel transport system substrate-binding protein|nr:ABC transporter substrate-binding protein [Sphingomicrobium sp.]
MRFNAVHRVAALGLAMALAVSAGGCDRKSEGVIHVVVIGDQPQLADPARGPLSKPDQVLVDNAAQGLVQFDPRGQIVPGLGETWNVSDDGLSYIFRLANGTWPDGRKITADQVARMLRKLIAPGSRDPLKDAFGSVDDIVAMTDRVIEIRLSQPRPHLLQLLAQPEMGLVYAGQGTGPFSIDKAKSKKAAIRLTREVPTPDEEETKREQLDLTGAKAKEAIEAFVAGDADLVLGGTFVDLPFVARNKLPRRALQFDPASGLFGLVPARNSGPAANADIRRLLSQAIDREALVAALSVPGLVPRATVLEPALDNIADPLPPQWLATSLADRRPELAASARKLFPQDKPAIIRIALPDGPGADILFNRLATDWGALGLKVQRAGDNAPADFTLIDEVAPSSSASWFLRRFRCGVVPVCDAQIDEVLAAARTTSVLPQRSALLLDASRQIDSEQLFLPIAAPIRWSLVSARITSFAGNRFALHTLIGLEQKLDGSGT